jgi:[ribosomal protein S18]-alanine N-acetyltransferase
LLDPESWKERYCAVLQDGELAGFFSFEQDGETITIGLGLKPELIGKGTGQDFVQAGLEFAKQKYRPSRFLLSVATFNKRAIRLYTHLGFKSDRISMIKTNGGEYEFLQMVWNVDS